MKDVVSAPSKFSVQGEDRPGPRTPGQLQGLVGQAKEGLTLQMRQGVSGNSQQRPSEG